MSDRKSPDFGLLDKVKLALNLHALAFITRYIFFASSYNYF